MAIMENILAYITGNDLGGLVWECVKLCLLGVVVGLAAGLTAFLWIRRLKGYALDGHTAKWARAGVGVFTVLIFVIGFAVVGFMEGALHFSQKLVRDQKAITKACEKPCYQVSRLIAELYLAGSTTSPVNTNVASDDDIGRQLKALEDGVQEIDVKELDRRIDNLAETALTPVINAVMARAVQKWPALANPPYKARMEKFLKAVGVEILKKKVMNDADKLLGVKVDKFVREVLRGLPAEAALHGDPATISVKDLSAYISRHLVERIFLGTVRDLVRTIQMYAYLAMVLTLVLPVGMFYIVRRANDSVRAKET